MPPARQWSGRLHKDEHCQPAINLAIKRCLSKLSDRFSDMYLNFLSPFLAQAGAPAGGPPQQNPIIAFLPMILLVIVFYFFLMRPQQKRAKEQAKLLQNLKSGDKVGTTSGIIGTVITVKDTSVTLRSADSKLEVAKSAVTEILESSNAAGNPATN
jgi:preprotein translocase subunit YajC